jgi:CRISPR/Cas system-associated protein endoribonuclease Cas2
VTDEFVQFRQVFGLHMLKLHIYLVDKTVYSGFCLGRFSVYSGFCLGRFSVYSWFCLDRFSVYSRLCLERFSV